MELESVKKRIQHILISFVLWMVVLWVSKTLNLDRTMYPAIDFYTYFSLYCVLSELIFLLCFNPDLLGYVAICGSCAVWKSASELSIVQDSYNTIGTAHVSIITFICVIITGVIIHELYHYPEIRFSVGMTIGSIMFNICMAIFVSGLDQIAIDIKRWQVFYYMILLIQEKKYYLISSILWGAMISEIASHGLQPPY